MSSLRVLLSDPAFDAEGHDLEFRLTYEGPLYADNRASGSVAVQKAKHKQELRKVFHKQLRRLWEIAPQLRTERKSSDHFIALSGPAQPHEIATLATRFTRNGYQFVPLVTEDINVGCSVDVLFLRTDEPGTIINAGDIDNRLKTIFDALTMPRDQGQLGGYDMPDADEAPFFCLLEDDRLMTRASVETDRLLQPTSPTADASDARVVITVRLTPFNVTPWNLKFA